MSPHTYPRDIPPLSLLSRDPDRGYQMLTLAGVATKQAVFSGTTERKLVKHMPK